MDKKRVGMYIRVSTFDQAVNGTSLESQEEALRKFILANDEFGWELAENGVYIDDGYSGAKGREQRPEFNRILTDVENGRIDVLLVHKVDRLARDAGIILDAIKICDENNVQFSSKSDGIDTRTINGKLLLTILSAMAEMEKALIFERTYSGRIAGLKKGYATMGGFDLPLGYMKGEDKKILIDETYVPIIRRMYALCIEGKTPKEIADVFTLEGITTWWDKKMEKAKKVQIKKGVWSADTVRNALLNPIYKGIYYFGKTKTIKKGTEEFVIDVPEEQQIAVPIPVGIISPEDWEKSRIQIQKINKITRGRGESHIFTGLIKCGFDGMGYICYKQKKDGKEYFYYRCGGTNTSKTSNKKKDTDLGVLNAPICNNLQVPEEELYNKCIKIITQFVEHPEVLYSEKIGNDKEFIKNQKLLEADLKANKDKLAVVEKIITALMIDKYRDLENKENIEKAIEIHSKDKKTLIKKIEECEKNLQLSENQLHSGKQLNEFAKTYKDKLDKLTIEQGTQLIRLLVEKIEVKGTIVNIFFKFKPHPEAYTTTEIVKKNSNNLEGGDFEGNSTLNYKSLHGFPIKRYKK